MARRNNGSKPTLLTEATVSKFMKLANLGDLAGDFKRNMGYRDNGPDRYWEQPGLSKYRSNLLREQEEGELDPAEEPMDDAAADAPMDEPAGGGVEAQVEEIVSAIADAIESVVPEVSVDVAAGGDAEAAGMPAVEEPPVDGPADLGDEAALRETISKAIRETLLQREDMEGNVATDPSALVGPGSADQLSEQDDEAGAADSPEVEAVVDAIVDALEATTDMEVTSEPAAGGAAAEDEEPDVEVEGQYEGMDPEAEEGDPELQAMMEALGNRKTARRLIGRVMQRAKAEAAKPKRGSRRLSESAKARMRKAVRASSGGTKSIRKKITRRRR